VEFPDSSGTPLACPGATIREHDPVLEKTIPSPAIKPILVYQVWARGIQQGEPISLGICNSNMRFFKKLHRRSVRGAFLRLFVWSHMGNPVAPLGSADSLRELLGLVHRFINSIMNLFTQDLVARHPGHKGIYPRLKPGFLRSG